MQNVSLRLALLNIHVVMLTLYSIPFLITLPFPLPQVLDPCTTHYRCLFHIHVAFPLLGNYPAAVEDFQDCLSLQLKHLPPHSRLVAETHYQLGMTYCITGQYSQAIQHYSSSVKVIESRLGKVDKYNNTCHMSMHFII